MLYFIFTVDGDWKEYFNINLPEEKRLPQTKLLQELIEREIEIAQRQLNGHFLHFIHTSERARTFFLKEPFISIWRKIVKGQGDIGIHCHEDDPYKDFYIDDFSRIKNTISQQTSILREKGLDVCAYRGGYLAFRPQLLPILEENGLYFDFSCEPGRFFVHNKKVVSDWRDSPLSFYQMSYEDHRKIGDSRVFEIPIGSSKGNFLYFEKASPKIIEEVASSLKEKANKESGDIVVSVLTHTYEYRLEEIKIIEEKIILLKKYGRFINLKELQELIERPPKKS